MHLESLKIYNFRNLQDTEVTFDPGVNFFIGKNGQGKTNLVEAINFLSSGRSFRTQKSKELIRFGSKDLSVFGHVLHADWDVDLGVSIESSKRKAFVNGDQVKTLQDYIGKLICVSFTPGDLILIKGPPGERRVFLDKYLSSLDSQYFDILVRYNKALSHKRALLHEDQLKRQEVSTWNEILSDWIVLIHKKRLEFLRKLEALASKTYNRLAPADGPVKLVLESKLSGEDTGADVYQMLEEAMDKEWRQRSCLIGPHRDDIDITFGDLSARSYASQGQTRSLVLSLLSGVIDLIKEETGEFPVILLDDVESELDASRNKHLVEIVMEKEAQVIITGTDASAYKDYAEKNIRVIASGEISSLETTNLKMPYESPTVIARS